MPACAYRAVYIATTWAHLQTVENFIQQNGSMRIAIYVLWSVVCSPPSAQYCPARWEEITSTLSSMLVSMAFQAPWSQISI